MFTLRFKVLCAAGALLALLPAAKGENPFNLFQTGRFEPIEMHGKPSAARGWYLFDNGRAASPVYTPGDKCFKLDFPGDGSLIFRFLSPLADAYKRNPRALYFGSRIPWPQDQLPPAKEYRISGRLLFEKGTLRLSNDYAFEPAPGWRKFSITTAQPCNGFLMTPVEGAAYGFADLEQFAVYPEIGGAIALPDGGKLTRFLVPANASYVTRWAVAMWRGWFWRLTGVALPIEEVAEVAPSPGTFTATIGKTAPGGWELKVDRDGIRLSVGDEKTIVPALFDYLRLGLKCGFYTRDCVKLPDRVDALPAIDRQAAPRFRVLTGDNSWFGMNGGVILPLLYTRNDVDYYHLPEPRNDHILNVILPQEIYFKEHPEYFMVDRHGHRAERSPYHTNPCFSNPEAVRIMLKNLLAYAKGQTLAKELIFEVGDIQDHCVCPQCVAFNGGSRSNTDSQFAFANKFAKLLEKECPDMTLVRCAYFSRQEPPQRVRLESDRILPIIYCLDHTVFPCTLHVDCPANTRGIELMAKWLKFLDGDRSRLAFMTYSDIRPLHHVKFMDFVNRSGTGTLYMFTWKGYSPTTAFITGRWNLGENAEELLKEFNDAYYGAAGPYITQIEQLVEEYASTFRHPKSELGRRAHIGVWGSDLGETCTLLDRECFDRIYALFDKALQAVRDDRESLRRVTVEKSFYLAEDLHRYNRFKAKNEGELRAFADRLAELIGMARSFPENFNNLLTADPRNYIMTVAGISIPRGKSHWSREAVIDRFLADPMAMFRSAPEPFPAGLYFKPITMRAENSPAVYNYRCPPRSAVALLRKRFGKDRLNVEMKLAEAVPYPSFLTIEGLDDDKAGTSRFAVSVNGTQLYEGPVKFPETQWGRMGFSIPGGVLKAGSNTISVLCTTPESKDPEQQQSSQWGWVQISEIFWNNPNRDFLNCLAGKSAAWHFGAEAAQYLPRGEVKTGGGKVVIKGGKSKRTGICYFREHRFPCITMNHGDKMRFRITASGRGTLRAGLWQYRPYRMAGPRAQEIPTGGYAPRGKYLGPVASKPLALGPQAKEYVCEVAVTDACGAVIPEIFVDNDGEATVTALTVELIPAH